MTLKSDGNVVKDMSTTTVFPLGLHVTEENPNTDVHVGDVGAVNYVGRVTISLSPVTCVTENVTSNV